MNNIDSDFINQICVLSRVSDGARTLPIGDCLVSLSGFQDSEFKGSVETINSFLKQFDPSTVPLAEKGEVGMPAANTSLSYAGIRTEVIVVKPQGQTGSDLIFSTGVCPLPKDNLLPFYRQLLVWNNMQTDVAHFAISDTQNAAFMIVRRPILGLDYSEFRYCVDKISTVTLCCLLQLKQKFSF